VSRRHDQAIELRDAALAVLRKNGKQAGDSIVFEQHTPQDELKTHLSLRLSKHPFDAHNVLSVLTNTNNEYTAVLNIEWRGNAVDIVSFRRGQWENELLAMGRAIPGH